MQIETKKIPDSIKTDKYPELFGLSLFKGRPLFEYAEHLFVCGMNQMVEGYLGGNFEFLQITKAPVDIEPTGFFPAIDSDKKVVLTTPYSSCAIISYKAASLVVWLLCIEQIANSINEQGVRQKIYDTIQDIKYCYSRAHDEHGEKLFNEEDCQGIYKLID